MTYQSFSRRHALTFLGGAFAVAGAAFSASAFGSRPPKDAMPSDNGMTVGGGSATDAPRQAPGFDALTDAEWAALTDEDWRARLPADAFGVLRLENTERPKSSPLNTEKRNGWFACAGCGLILFSSAHKYDSGTGWPSFFDVIPGRIATKPDRKLFYVRTEYHCDRCGGHQGHVFDDGPAPTGNRWCNNGVALTFVPKAQLS